MRPLLVSITLVSIALPALAEAGSASVELPLDLQYQDLGLEPAVNVELVPGLSLQSVVVFESARPSEVGAQELLLRHEGERLSLWGGKFNPEFGMAWDQDVAPYDLHAGSYELSEQRGLGGALAFGDEDASQLRLSGNLFGDPAAWSYTVNLEAQPLPGLRLHSGIMKVDEDRGLLVGATAEFSVGERNLAPLLEVARVASEIVWTTGVRLEEGGMQYSLQHSSRSASSGDESIVQATALWAL